MAEQDEAVEGAAKEGAAEGAEEMEEVDLEEADEEEASGAKAEAGAKEAAAEVDELMDFGKDDEAAEEEEEPAPPAPPAEPEGDEVRDWEKLPPVKHEVAFESIDATPNVFGFGGVVLSSLCDGPFKQLLSGARANTGAKAGRYLFEVKVLERFKQVIPELRVGFSLAGSSLFLGDGSTEAVAFGSDGTYYLAEPGQLSSLTRANAAKPFEADSVIGILLNLDPASQAAFTVSLFLDGVRASQPQSVPAHLRGKALYPTVTFRGMALAVNFGRSGAQLRALPFKCGMFAQLAEEHHERSSASSELRAPALPAAPSGKGPNELVVVVGLPEGGLFDFATYYLERNPAALEVSGRSYAAWCRRSGRRPLRDLGKGRSLDRPDLAFADPPLGSRPWRRPLLTGAHLAGRSCVVAEVCGGLLRTEREELLSSAPASMRKVAIVVAGEPSDGFKAWVRDRIKADYEMKKAIVEKRRMLAEAAGDKLPEEQLRLPAAPNLESVSFLPKEDASVPDVAEEDVARWHAKFSLPDDAEGFDEVRYEWLGKDAAHDLLHNWVLARKATFLVEGLTPGPWFKGKVDAWKQERTKIRQRHTDHFKKVRAANGDGAANEEGEPTFDLKSVADIHDADGKGTPVYARFRYEDWLLLSWRYELHLLAHAFTEDVADPDIPGMPEDHVAHYFTLYFGSPFEPQKLGVDTLAEAMQLLKEPLELVSRPSGGPGRILRSTRPKEAGLDAFVVGVEVYRRDRIRRMEAGDESAQLVFPKANKPPAKACPGKAAPGKAVQKAPPPKDGGAKAPIAKRAPTGATQPPVNRAPAPGAKAPIAKTAPRGAVAPARPAGPGAVGGGARPAKAAPRGTVASTAAPAGGVKRPLPPEGPPPDGLGPPPVKRPRPPSAPPPGPGPKAPIAKRKPT